MSTVWAPYVGTEPLTCGMLHACIERHIKPREAPSVDIPPATPATPGTPEPSPCKTCGEPLPPYCSSYLCDMCTLRAMIVNGDPLQLLSVPPALPDTYDPTERVKSDALAAEREINALRRRIREQLDNVLDGRSVMPEE